jgi:hypothetical protein
MSRHFLVGKNKEPPSHHISIIGRPSLTSRLPTYYTTDFLLTTLQTSHLLHYRLPTYYTTDYRLPTYYTRYHEEYSALDVCHGSSQLCQVALSSLSVVIGYSLLRSPSRGHVLFFIMYVCFCPVM